MVLDSAFNLSCHSESLVRERVRSSAVALHSNLTSCSVLCMDNSLCNSRVSIISGI